jgi:hypothetical protein
MLRSQTDTEVDINSAWSEELGPYFTVSSETPPTWRARSPYFEVTLVQCKISNITIGRAAWEAYSATWNLGTNSAFALGPRKTTENLDRVGRSQDLLNATDF